MSVLTPGRLRRGRLLDTYYRYFCGGLRMIFSRQWALASSGWITLLCVEYLPPGSLLRVLVVFAFVLFCPGFAVARLLPTREPAERWVLAVALSMSFGLLITVGMTVMRNGSVSISIGLLALVTTIAVLAGAATSSRRPTSPAPINEDGNQ